MIAEWQKGTVMEQREIIIAVSIICIVLIVASLSNLVFILFLNRTIRKKEKNIIEDTEKILYLMSLKRDESDVKFQKYYREIKELKKNLDKAQVLKNKKDQKKYEKQYRMKLREFIYYIDGRDFA